MTSILLAIVIGAAFGATLDRIGAANPNMAMKMLSLADSHLVRTILLAIGVSSVLMFGGQMAGLISVGNMSVKAAYAGVFVGGLLMGTGWALSGYCPGTGVCAAATGRKDALFFIGGGLIGAAAYMATYPFWKASGLLESLAGGKVTLGTVPQAKYDGLTGLPGDVLGIVLGAALIASAFLLPDRTKGAPAEATPAE